MSNSPIKIIECPRDAMQGLHQFVPTADKIRYINKLLEVGFDTIDFGSFVSPKAIPQMKDTAEVLANLHLSKSNTKLLAIIANERGAEEAVKYAEVTYLGFPLSLSETFQKKNTNKSIEDAFVDLENIQALCIKNNKTLVTYLSMGFGNPYGDHFDESYMEEFVSRLDQMEVTIVSPSDTIGVSNPEIIKRLFNALISKFPYIEFGAHLHSSPDTSTEKLEAAFKAGVIRFDGAIKGYGGCPMANDDLVGNMATENMLDFFAGNSVNLNINKEKFKEAVKIASEIFPPK
jgi:hydroxymethylglutaryl-CoA lyase